MDEQKLLGELKEQIEVLRLAKSEADVALRQSRRQNQSLFENMLDVYYQTDMEGRLLLISPSCLPQTGYRPEEVIGRPVTDFYAIPAERDELLKALYRDGKVNDYTVKLLHKDGMPRYASVTSRVMLDEDRRPVGIEGILRDVTERRRIESEQQRLLEENRKLMRRLMQVQEQERRMLARDLHDELGQLLTSIDARAEYISKHAAEADIRAVAEEIIRDTRTSFDSSHDVLMQLRPATLDALGLSAALTELARHWEKQTGMDCPLHVAGDIDDLDEMHTIAIYRLVQEGLTNAWRHGRADRAEVMLKVYSQDEGAGTVHIEITDNGKGLHVEKAAVGMGVIGMRERVHALDGTFMLTNLPADGVRIEAIMPLHREGGAGSHD